MRETKIIIFIDDDDAYLLIAQKATQKIDIKTSCFFCQNGEDGITLITNLLNNNQYPDCIFLDLNMPMISGFDFLNLFTKLRKNYPLLNNSKIIIMSSSENENDKLKAKELGAHDYIAKPNLLKELIVAITFQISS